MYIVMMIHTLYHNINTNNIVGPDPWPVCLSENVDCIVVNDRHSGDPEIGRLLDVFVERNKCNLIWMEPESELTYPTFDGE